MTDPRRDEDGMTLWTADASRAIARGDYGGAIAVLVEAGQELLPAERFVAVSLAVNTPRQIHDRRLLALVETARQAMQLIGWTFADVAAAVEKLQLSITENAA